MNVSRSLKNTLKLSHYVSKRWTSENIPTIIDAPDTFSPVSSFREHTDEDMKTLKARLVYQSRKRGMLENGLLLSTFAAKYLDTMDEKQLRLYDMLINKPSNDWDLYYWVTGVKETPQEFQHEVMEMFKRHVDNSERESRLRQPDLY